MELKLHLKVPSGCSVSVHLTWKLKLDSGHSVSLSGVELVSSVSSSLSLESSCTFCGAVMQVLYVSVLAVKTLMRLRSRCMVHHMVLVSYWCIGVLCPSVVSVSRVEMIVMLLCSGPAGLVILLIRARMSASMESTRSPACVYLFLAMAALFVIVFAMRCCCFGIVVPRLGAQGMGSFDWSVHKKCSAARHQIMCASLMSRLSMAV